MPTKHGTIAPPTPQTTEPPAIPIALRRASIVLNEKNEVAEKAYGIWDMTALRDVRIHGKQIAAGDTFRVHGGIAWQLAMQNDAAFSDDRTAKESAIIKDAVRLGLPPKISELAAFAK